MNSEELKKIDRSLLVPNIVSLFLPILSVNKGDVLSSFNLKTIDDCLILYNKYYKEMDKNLNLCKNIINIKFEELIENPKRILNKVFDFINVEISINSLAEIKKIIDRKRSLAYKNQIINYDTNLLDEINY